jgi:adenine-specific DNA-methyltransferase
VPIKKSAAAKAVKSLTHEEAKRRNIPTAEYESVVEPADKSPIRVAYERRNRDLDPQLVWRGKDEQDASDLVVQAPPLYIQEKVHPKALIDDLLHDTRERAHEAGEIMPDLFADFNGLPKGVDKTEFYRHDQNWSNRMILGDSLQVMASLAEREGLRGKVQCIYIDPPYGIKFNSNFQWSTTSVDVKDGNAAHITREPEQVKAFRDTWRDGIHSYLNYLRERLTLAHDLLAESGSIFVQIGDENVHRVRALMDEVFGDDNFMSLITFVKTSSSTANELASVSDYLIWYARSRPSIKFRAPTVTKTLTGIGGGEYRSVSFLDGTSRRLTEEEVAAPELLPADARIFRLDTLTSQSPGSKYTVELSGRSFYPAGYWKTEESSMERLIGAGRIVARAQSLGYLRFFDDYGSVVLANTWTDTQIAGRPGDKVYVVQTLPKVIQRCFLMTTDPGDLVLDPTCGSGTSAMVAEQWGRRWITIDTSRVALALARARVMGARYPYYLLADSREGQLKEAGLTGTIPSLQPTHGNIRQGFVYERVSHITLKSIANNSEIDVISEKWKVTLEPLRETLNGVLSKKWKEWEIPREAGAGWSEQAQLVHAKWWEARIAQQREIDASIAARAEFEYLYDKPYEDKKTVRIAGPFTVESLSPHRELGLDENDQALDPLERAQAEKTFAEIILDNLKTAGVQQAHKEDKIAFTSVVPWPGDYVCAEGRYAEGSDGAGAQKRAGIFIGPEFGTITRQYLVLAAREASDAGFDVLIACGFNYEAHTTEFTKLGHLPVLKARMNADLQGEPLRRFRRTGHDAADGRRQAAREDQRRRRLSPQHRRSDKLRARPNRLLVHRHRLQRGELLRPARLLSRRQRSVRCPQTNVESRDRRRRLVHSQQRYLTRISKAEVRPNCGQGHQQSR